MRPELKGCIEAIRQAKPSARLKPCASCVFLVDCSQRGNASKATLAENWTTVTKFRFWPDSAALPQALGASQSSVPRNADCRSRNKRQVLVMPALALPDKKKLVLADASLLTTRRDALRSPYATLPHCHLER